MRWFSEHRCLLQSLTFLVQSSEHREEEKNRFCTLPSDQHTHMHMHTHSHVSILVKGFTPWIKHHGQEQPGKERDYLGLHVPTMVHHQRNSGRELSRGHQGRVLTGLFLKACSACFLIAPRMTIPRVGTLTVRGTFPHQPSIVETHCRLSHRLCGGDISSFEVPAPKWHQLVLS